MEKLNAFIASYVRELSVAPSASGYCRLSSAADDFRRLRCVLDAVGHDSVELGAAIAGYEEAVQRLHATATDARDRVLLYGVAPAGVQQHKKDD